MKNSLLVYICGVGGPPPEWLRILPLGKIEFREGDGREPFEVTTEGLNATVQKFQANKVDLVVDYEHQSLGTGPAPAAGWIKELQARADGLYARIKWTAKALKHLLEGEYRYYSPVFTVDLATRKFVDLKNMALTNNPGLNGDHLAPLLAAKYGEGGAPEIIIMETSQASPAAKQEEEAMLKRLAAKLGLPPEATEEQVLAALESRGQEVVALKAQTAALPEIAAALGLEKDADAAKITGTILALKQGAEQLSSLRTDLEALKLKQSQGVAQKAVDEALVAKKITPAQREWALKLATEKPESFAAFVTAAAPVLETEPLKIKTKDGKGEFSLTTAELEMCKLTGVTPEAFKASKDSLAEGQA